VLATVPVLLWPQRGPCRPAPRRAGPWAQLLDVARMEELKLDTEVSIERGASYRRATTSVAGIVERLRAERRHGGASATLASMATLGSMASLGASLGASQGDKLSASQYATGAARAGTQY